MASDFGYYTDEERSVVVTSLSLSVYRDAYEQYPAGHEQLETRKLNLIFYDYIFKNSITLKIEKKCVVGGTGTAWIAKPKRFKICL